jgi:hypothetical protein
MLMACNVARQSFTESDVFFVLLLSSPFKRHDSTTFSLSINTHTRRLQLHRWVRTHLRISGQRLRFCLNAALAKVVYGYPCGALPVYQVIYAMLFFMDDATKRI